MNARFLHLGPWLAAVLAGLLSFATPAQAERNTLGPHLGFNFDSEDLLLGIESRIDLAQAGHSVIIQLNPSFSYYFIENVDLFNISINVPFEFVIDGSVVRPFASPGLAIFAGDPDTELRLNLIGGLLFRLDAVDPFVQLRAAVIEGSFVDLMGGVLFRL